jgi:hypothetical protein
MQNDVMLCVCQRISHKNSALLHCLTRNRVVQTVGKNIGGGITVPFLIDITTVVLIVVSLVTWLRDGRTKKGERGLLRS